MKRLITVTIVIMSIVFLAHGKSIAKTTVQDTEQKSSAIQKFLKNTMPKFKSVKGEPGITEVGTANSDINVLPDGEVLFLTARLQHRLKLEGIIFAQSRNNKIAVSLKDFIQVLFFPIDINLKEGKASGWYIRENKKFELDLNSRIAKTDQGEFQISDDVFIEDDDVFVPINELQKWINFEIHPRISAQELLIIPSQLLPLQEKMERKKKNHIAAKPPKPLLPTINFPKKLIDIPVIDVASNLNLNRDGKTGDRKNSFTSSMTTRGDFAHGTLTTSSQYTNKEGLRRVQATYKQESKDPNLLGPLNLRRYEIGDVTTSRLPIGNNAEQNLGFRITNKDPLNNLTSPTSRISGTTLPEWDVELFRGNQFLALQTVDENGFFSFDNVNLFSQDNNFRLVFYGPQGEIREELVSVPIDTSRISDSSGVYDLSITLEDEQTYLADRSRRNKDSGSLNINALYERPIGTESAVSFGFYSDQANETRNYVGQLGLSTAINNTLLNLNIASDDEFNTNAKLTTRRSFGNHDVNTTTSYIEQGFDFLDADEELPVSIFEQRLSSIGPIPYIDSINTRYSTNFNFRETSNGDTSFNSNLGVNTRWKGLTLNEQLSYQNSDLLEDYQLSSLSTLSGTYGKNRIRANVNYNVKPKNELSNAFIDIVHEVSNDLDIRANLQRNFDRALTEVSLNVDWKTGYARLSPRIEYNSDNDFFIGLGTRFSILREPKQGAFRAIDRNISRNGGFSAFVYLDENGNNKLDENEKPLEGVVVKALQNGGIQTTDKNGIALFTNMVALKLTDIVIEERSLSDPLWISGYEGLSVLPRSGHFAQADFPIHIAGELDGSIFGERVSGSKKPMKNVGISLFSLDGKLEETTVTDAGGFYFFSRVAPGIYYLIVNEKSAKVKNFIRPPPEKIEIGYNGTLIFGKDIAVQLNKKDVPIDFVNNYAALKERHPHIPFDDTDLKFMLNLGEYKSQMYMSLMWYKLRKKFPTLLYNTKLLIQPKQSYADPKTGMHSLRLSLQKWTFNQAYEQCRILIAANRDCKIELIPNGEDLISEGVETANIN